MTTTMQCPFHYATNIGERPIAEQLHSSAACLAADLADLDGTGGTERLDDDAYRRSQLVSHARRLVTDAEEVLRLTVTAARDHGASWQEIADVLDVTRQAAQQRFGAAHAFGSAAHAAAEQYVRSHGAATPS